MSYLATVEVPKVQWDAFRREMKFIPINARIAGQKALHSIAFRFYLNIKGRYKSLSEPSLKDSTLERRQYGKPTSSSTRPLTRTGQLIKLVEQRVTLGKGSYTSRVRIQPNVRLSGGGISNKVAEDNEFGAMYTIPITDKMMRYLRMLLVKSGRYEEVMGKNRSKPPNTSGIIRGFTPLRPVWVPAILALNAKQPEEFALKFFSQLNRRSKLLRFKFPGAR